MDIDQREYNVAKQNGRIIHTKINILNFDFQVVDEISGVVLDGSSYNIDATSDIRRTCNISLIPKDKSFNVEYGGKLWMDKYIQVFIGIEDVSNNNEIVYSNLGLYLINNPDQVYDATNNTITISGVDLMAKITGLRNGYLGFGEGTQIATAYQIPMATGIKQSMTKVINQLCGFNLYSIDQPTPTILTPYDMSFGLGSTAYNMIAQLRDINAGYQTYFDQDGIFWFNPIPTGSNEQIRVDDDIWKKVLISYKKTTDFESVKNYIEVFGKTQDDGHTPYGCTFDDNEDSPFNINLNGDNQNIIRIVLSGGEYDNIYPEPIPNTTTVDYNYFEVVTNIQPTDSPKRKRWYTKTGNVYTLSEDKLPVLGTTYYRRLFDSLAQQRAEYELYLRCRLQDQIELTCVPVYWLDVNWLTEITLPNKQSGEEKTEQYIIKKISTTLGANGTQNITLMKYYPLYPWG